MIRRIAAAIVIATLIVVFISGPTTYTNVTGEPLFVDCGNTAAARCNEAWRSKAQEEDVATPITWVRVHIAPGNGTCGDYSFGSFWPFFDPSPTLFQPLC